VPATTLQTPVDLHNYTAHLSRAAEAVPVEAAASQAAEGAAAAAGAPQFAVSRRAALDLSLPLAPADPVTTFRPSCGARAERRETGGPARARPTTGADLPGSARVTYTR
jgi:hypothetical protein